MSAAEGKLALWNHDHHHDISELLTGSCEVHVARKGSNLHVEIHKRATRRDES